MSMPTPEQIRAAGEKAMRKMRETFGPRPKASDKLTMREALELVRDCSSQEWQQPDGKRMGATDNSGRRMWFITEDVMQAVRDVLSPAPANGFTPPYPMPPAARPSWARPEDEDGVAAVHPPCPSVDTRAEDYCAWKTEWDKGHPYAPAEGDAFDAGFRAAWKRACGVEGRLPPTNEELRELWNKHGGHPEDFAADVLERWGGWPPGVLGQGGTAGVEPSDPARRTLPHPGSPEASAMMDSLLAEYQWPANTKNAARAGWEAAERWLRTSGVLGTFNDQQEADHG